MNLKLRAAGYTAGVLSLFFGSLAVLTYIAKEQAMYIFAAGLLAYLVYVMYSVVLSDLEHKESEMRIAENIVKSKQKIAELEKLQK
jgi:hypothetical protein